MILLSLRVNLDMEKTVYAHLIMAIPSGRVELGRNRRITYLLSDKTGTLAQNGIIIIFVILLCHDGLLGIEMKNCIWERCRTAPT